MLKKKQKKNKKKMSLGTLCCVLGKDTHSASLHPEYWQTYYWGYLETGMSSSLMSHLACMQTLPYLYYY